jgi:hypothetical protein
MAVIITLQNDLADRLARKAESRRVSLQDWAVRILEESLDNADDAAWSRLNARRLALISKEDTSGLTSPEQGELAALQDAAAKACERQDRPLLEKLSSLPADATDARATMLASEAALRRDWDRPEEDAVWAHL